MRRVWPWLAFVSGVSAFCVTNYLYRTEHNPPVGVYIAIMGLVAACVTFRDEPSRSEKALWIIVMTILMVAEIQNLYLADSRQTAQFREISNSLKDTKDGLQAAVWSLKGLRRQIGDTSIDTVFKRNQKIRDDLDRLSNDVIYFGNRYRMVMGETEDAYKMGIQRASTPAQKATVVQQFTTDKQTNENVWQQSFDKDIKLRLIDLRKRLRAARGQENEIDSAAPLFANAKPEQAYQCVEELKFLAKGLNP